jgi:hypothetical protein
MPAECAIDNNVSFKNNFESNNHTLSDNTPLPTGGIRSRNTAGGTNLQLLSSNGSSQSSNCSYHTQQSLQSMINEFTHALDEANLATHKMLNVIRSTFGSNNNAEAKVKSN